MRKEAEAHSEDDRKKRELIDERNKADSLIYQTEKTLKEHGAKVPESDRKKIEDAVAALNKVKGGDDPEEIRRRAEELMNASQVIGKLLYEEAARQRGEDAGPAGAERAGRRPAAAGARRAAASPARAEPDSPATMSWTPTSRCSTRTRTRTRSKFQFPISNGRRMEDRAFLRPRPFALLRAFARRFIDTSGAERDNGAASRERNVTGKRRTSNIQSPTPNIAARNRGRRRTSPVVQPEAGIGGWKSVALGLAIVAITLAAYVPALRGGFVWDDYGFFIDNPLIENPHGLHDIWLTTEPQDYFALTSTMLWAEWQAWGMNPVGYHVVNVLLHAAAAVLLWRVLRRLRVPGAWLGAALFAVHPVATLSAAWITEGKNTLSLALYLLALWAFLDYDERGGKGRYVLSLAVLSSGAAGEGIGRRAAVRAAAVRLVAARPDHVEGHRRAACRSSRWRWRWDW